MEIFKLFGSIVIKDEEALKKLDSIDKKGSSVGKTFDKMRLLKIWGKQLNLVHLKQLKP